MRDKLNIYGDYSVLEKKCPSCSSKNHCIFDCPLLNYIPSSKISLISRYRKENVNYSRIFIFRKRKKKNINSKMLKNELSNIFPIFLKKHQSLIVKLEKFGSFFIYLKKKK